MLYFRPEISLFCLLLPLSVSPPSLHSLSYLFKHLVSLPFYQTCFLSLILPLFPFFGSFLHYLFCFLALFLLLSSLESGMYSIALRIIFITNCGIYFALFRLTISFFYPFLPLFMSPFSPLPLLSLQPSGKSSSPSNLFPVTHLAHFCLYFTFFVPFWLFYLPFFCLSLLPPGM